MNRPRPLFKLRRAGTGPVDPPGFQEMSRLSWPKTGERPLLGAPWSLFPRVHHLPLLARGLFVQPVPVGPFPLFKVSPHSVGPNFPIPVPPPFADAVFLRAGCWWPSAPALSPLFSLLWLAGWPEIFAISRSRTRVIVIFFFPPNTRHIPPPSVSRSGFPPMAVLPFFVETVHFWSLPRNFAAVFGRHDFLF